MDKDLTTQDWHRLEDYSKVIAKSIKSKLPSDWYLSLEDIQGEIRGEYANLLDQYKPGKKSPVSYCYQFAEPHVHRDLMREYRKIKVQVQLPDESNDNSDDDTNDRHTIGEGEIKALTVDDTGRIEARDMANLIIDNVDEIGKEIALMLGEGLTQREIAKELGISQSRVARYIDRMREIA